jgi:hypothetical protein
MSQLVKLLRSAGRATGRPTAGFGSRQDSGRKRLILVAALDDTSLDKARKAVAAGADAVEAPTQHGGKAMEQLKALVAGLEVPVGAALGGGLPGDLDLKALEETGVDYVKVEAGDVPASVFLLDGPSVVLEVKENFTDTMLKMLNFLPAKVVQVDSPDKIEDFSVKQLMEKRVDRELIGKPLLMKVGAHIKPEAAKLLNLVSPNGLVVPAAEVAAWREAVADLKEPTEDEVEPGAGLRLRPAS